MAPDTKRSVRQIDKAGFRRLLSCVIHTSFIENLRQGNVGAYSPSYAESKMFDNFSLKEILTIADISEENRNHCNLDLV